jgi:hypothetical protein
VTRKQDKPIRFRRGNMAVIKPPCFPGLPEFLAMWESPPNVKGPRVLAHVDKHELVLITDVTVADGIQYSKIFSASQGISGWVNSRFLLKIDGESKPPTRAKLLEKRIMNRL